jgi:hypothetical protein
MSDLPQTKAELIERMETGYAALEDRLGQLSEAQLSKRPTASEWSIKDHLAHLAAYEYGIAALLRREPRWAAMQLNEQLVRDSQSFDEINAAIYQQQQERSLAEVQAAFRDAHHQLLAVLKNLTDADLFKTYADYQPHDPDANHQDPVLGWIVGNTYEHYAEHRPWMEELLARQE